jgi:ferredoxin
MADLATRWEDNVPGRYYVDKSCILCSLCSDLAPSNFVESQDGDHDKVMKQPSNEEEERNCRDDMEQCPVEAIGDDGESAP